MVANTGINRKIGLRISKRGKSAILSMLAALFFAGSILGCATPPQITQVLAKISLLGPGDIISPSLGGTSDSNPFLARKPLIGTQRDEFIVLRVDLELPSNGEVSVVPSAQNLEGIEVARYLEREELESYWQPYTNSKNELKDRERRLRSKYLPASTFIMKAGKASYYLVLSGRYPLPRASSVLCAVFADGNVLAQAELPLSVIVKR